MDVSGYRQQLHNLFNEQKRLVGTILRIRGIVRGGIYRSRSKCGKKGCKCEKENKLHETWKFYWSEGGKTRIRSISESDIMSYGRYTKEYQKYRYARAELVKLCRKQIKIIDLMEKELRIGITEKRLKKVGKV